MLKKIKVSWLWIKGITRRGHFTVTIGKEPRNEKRYHGRTTKQLLFGVLPKKKMRLDAFTYAGNREPAPQRLRLCNKAN